MTDPLIVVDSVILIALFIFFIVLFCLSVKKCFWKEGKSKVKLVILSILTNPVFTYLDALLVRDLVSCIVWPESVQNNQTLIREDWRSLLLLSLMAVMFYLAIILVFAWLMGKWLDAKPRHTMFFLYLMFNTIILSALMGGGSRDMFQIPYMGTILDIIENLILLLAAWLFYRLDIAKLSNISQKQMDTAVNWNFFLIPPALFIGLYTTLMIAMIYDTDMSEDKTVLVIDIFSSVIVYLFIWAFYVIIKNIIITNEAVTAKNEAITAKNEVKILSVEVMEALAHTIDAKDEYTRGHSVRVANYSRMIAEKLRLTQEECENVYYMGLLHDIGKIGVPNSIINSTSKLTDEQYSIIKTHPGVGYGILAEIKSRPDLSIGARWHHERYDGKGYPDGMNGMDIPFFARIIAVADSYDAMTSNRSYRAYLPQAVVRSEIEKNMGTQFDPDVAKCMLQIIDDDVNYELHE